MEQFCNKLALKKVTDAVLSCEAVGGVRVGEGVTAGGGLRRRIAQGASGLHFKGVGHGGPASGVLASCAAEGLKVGAEHKIVPRATLRRRRAPSMQE